MTKRFAALSLMTSILYLGEANAQALTHRIVVPEEYSWGCEAPVGCNASAAEAYVASYEKGWWHCIGLLSENLEYKLTQGDRAANGGPASAEGWFTGCTDAEKHVADMRSRYGREKTVSFLKQNVFDLMHWEGSDSETSK